MSCKKNFWCVEFWGMNEFISSPLYIIGYTNGYLGLTSCSVSCYTTKMMNLSIISVTSRTSFCSWWSTHHRRNSVCVCSLFVLLCDWCSRLRRTELSTGNGGTGDTNAVEDAILRLVMSEVVQGSMSSCTTWVLFVLICWIWTTTSDLNSVIRYGPNQSCVSLRLCWRSKGLGQHNQTSWPFVNKIAFTRASKYDLCVFDNRFVALRTRFCAARLLSRKWMLYGVIFCGVSFGGVAIDEQGRWTYRANMA